MAKIIHGPYLDDIQRQPQALADTCATLQPCAPIGMGAGPLVLTGMGASLHALVPLQLKLFAHGLQPSLIETSELVHHAPSLLRRGATVVAVSQSGQSAETVTLIQKLPPEVSLVAVTNEPNSPLAQAATQVLLTHAGAEATVSCKTYVTALLALEWLGANLVGENLETTRAELAQASAAVASYLHNWQAHAGDLGERLKSAALIYFVGRGPSCASAGAAGLITKEAVHFPAEGMSSAAFRHGPIEMVGPDVFVVAFEGLLATAHLNARLIQDVQERGGQGALCGTRGGGAFALPPAPDRLLPMLEILLPQMVTVALAARFGREAGRFSHATKVTATE